VMHADTVRRGWEPLIEMTLLESSLGRRIRSLDSYVVDSLLIQKKRCLDEGGVGAAAVLGMYVNTPSEHQTPISSTGCLSHFVPILRTIAP
jgi:hypothetical protein